MVNLNPAAIFESARARIQHAFEMRLQPRARIDAQLNNIRGMGAVSAPQIQSTNQTEATSFQNVLNDFISLGVPNSNINPEIDAAVVAASLEHGVDANLIRAIIRAESNYNPLTVSHAGAMGLMQLMPATARSLGVTNPFDIVQNINAGTAYIASLLERFNGDLELALAAYNAGWPRVQQHGGIPPFAETQAYVPRVLGFREEYLLQQYAQNSDNRRR
ncbi:MAG: lytic transglycosylase domain-containing protein [Clostridiales bacterium]|jgi:soluble lytic murein transglycosylase-like protein|nr:lytic transglycosylase domain-containing protein [Clostridiales bacterium]